MRITIEPTQRTDYVTASVSSPDDDEDIDSVVELFCAAMLAWGFDERSIREACGQALRNVRQPRE